MFVGNDRDSAGGQGEFYSFSDEGFITGVGRVDSDGLVAEEGFGAGGGDDNVFFMTLRRRIEKTV